MRALIRPEEAEHHPRANVITRAVGADLDDFVLDKVSGRIRAGDRFLLCSDGLCKTCAGGRTGRLLGENAGVPPSRDAGGCGAGAERERQRDRGGRGSRGVITSPRIDSRCPSDAGARFPSWPGFSRCASG